MAWPLKTLIAEDVLETKFFQKTWFLYKNINYSVSRLNRLRLNQVSDIDIYIDVQKNKFLETQFFEKTAFP